MAANEEVNEVLRRARDLVMRPNGWCQGRRMMQRESTMAYCAVGAIEASALWDHGMTEIPVNFVGKRLAVMRAAGRELYAVLDEFDDLDDLDDFVDAVEGWNDREGRTQDQVVGLFEKAIAREVIDDEAA